MKIDMKGIMANLEKKRNKSPLNQDSFDSKKEGRKTPVRSKKALTLKKSLTSDSPKKNAVNPRIQKHKVITTAVKQVTNAVKM